MSAHEITDLLKEMHEAHPELLISMVMTSDGFVSAHYGDIEDPDMLGAYFVEVKLVTERLFEQMEFGSIAEFFVRSQSGCVSILPIQDRGYLACMSGMTTSASKLQILNWKAVKNISKYL